MDAILTALAVEVAILLFVWACFIAAEKISG